MKTALLITSLLFSSFSFAQDNGLGEVDLKLCECPTCLVNGKCVMTLADGSKSVKEINNGHKGQTKSGKGEASGQ
jgi:hypothetical protein